MAALVVIGISVMAAHAVSAANASSSSTSTMTPALKLAYGTLNLEGTDQAVDSVAAAQLLPLWQLLDELNSSGSAAPEEITAVVEEIQLTMSPTQIKAINAMSISQSDLASASQSGAPSSTTNATTANSGAQVASAGTDPTMGGDMPAGGAPPDAGGSMPGGSSQQSTSTAKTSSTNGTPSLIKQVIQLLQSKLQS